MIGTMRVTPVVCPWLSTQARARSGHAGSGAKGTVSLQAVGKRFLMAMIAISACAAPVADAQPASRESLRADLKHDQTAEIAHRLSHDAFDASRIVMDAAGRPALECAGSNHPPSVVPMTPASAAPSSHAGATNLPASGSKQASVAIFEAVYGDPPNQGFFDPTPVAPAPGNPAVSLGAQRRAVFEAALTIWATRLESDVTIRVSARFADLGCVGSPAGLGGPSAILAGFDGAPDPGTLYPAALATALAGERLPGLDHEVTVVFSSRVEDRDCFTYVPDGFSYGLDMYAAPSVTAFPFIELALHEIGHGLGITALANLETGEFLGSPPTPDIYSRFLYSQSRQRIWPDMTPAERVASRFEAGDLTWAGDRVMQRARTVLFPPAEVRASTADGDSIHFDAAFHGFAPYLPMPGLDAALLLADNDTDQTPASPSSPRRRTDACQPVGAVPADSVTVLFATGGGCAFADKWRHGYEAGASGLLVADTREDSDPAAVARIGVALPERYPIPLWSVSASAGEALTARPPARVVLGYKSNVEPPGLWNGHLGMHPSVSHFTSATIPRLMMGTRSFSGAIMGFPDLGTDVLIDIGWPDAGGRQAQFSGAWFNPERSGEGCQLTLEGDDETFIVTCYVHRAGEQVWILGNAILQADVLDVASMHVTHGTGYGSAFDPDEVQRTHWGRIRMSFVDCNTAVLDLWPAIEGYSHFQTRMRRVVHGNCQLNAQAQPDRSRAGNYFAPDRSGEGIQVTVEADGRTAVLSWYSYHQGRQLWVIASGTFDGDTLHLRDAAVARGADFGRAFDPADVERIPFGTMSMQWQDCNTVELVIDPVFDDLESSRRTMTRVVPRQC